MRPTVTTHGNYYRGQMGPLIVIPQVTSRRRKITQIYEHSIRGCVCPSRPQSWRSMNII